MRFIQGLVGAVLFVAVPSASGCNGPDCIECCEILTSDRIYVASGGIDMKGFATVELMLLEKGMCELEYGDTFWLRWQMGTVSFSGPDMSGGLDSSVIMDREGAYTWTDRDLTVSRQQPKDSEITLTFMGAGKVTVTKCSAIIGPTISCSSM